MAGIVLKTALNKMVCHLANSIAKKIDFFYYYYYLIIFTEFIFFILIAKHGNVPENINRHNLSKEPHNFLYFDTIHPLKMPDKNLEKSFISFNFLTVKFHHNQMKTVFFFYFQIVLSSAALHI